MNPICVKNFDLNRLKTETTYFVDMCLASGADGCTAEGIFTAIDRISAKNHILRENCVFLKVDNTNNMIGKNNSIASKFSERNNQSQIFFFFSEGFILPIKVLSYQLKLKRFPVFLKLI